MTKINWKNFKNVFKYLFIIIQLITFVLICNYTISQISIMNNYIVFEQKDTIKLDM